MQNLYKAKLLRRRKKVADLSYRAMLYVKSPIRTNLILWNTQNYQFILDTKTNEIDIGACGGGCRARHTARVSLNSVSRDLWNF